MGHDGVAVAEAVRTDLSEVGLRSFESGAEIVRRLDDVLTQSLDRRTRHSAEDVPERVRQAHSGRPRLVEHSGGGAEFGFERLGVCGLAVRGL